MDVSSCSVSSMDPLQLYSPELRDALAAPPQPLVFVLGDGVDVGPSAGAEGAAAGAAGAVAAHDQLISVLVAVEPDPPPPALEYRPVRADYTFPPKKRRVDRPGEARAPDGRSAVPGGGETLGGLPLPAPAPDGILKAGWLRKHARTLPAVVLLVKSFDAAASHPEWAATEARAADEIERLRAQLAPRECALLVLLLRRNGEAVKAAAPRVGGTGGSGDETPLSELEEERVSALRRRCAASLEPKALFVMDVRDEMQPHSGVARRLARAVRELALRHYASQARRVRRWERLLNRQTQQPLLVRYALKVGYLSEFQRADDAALRHYSEAFLLALELPGAAAIGHHPLAAQARAVAEFLHVKIVRYSLSSGLAHDAARQMLRFARHFRAPPAAASFDSAELLAASNVAAAVTAAEHYGWLAHQHRVFAHLLVGHGAAPPLPSPTAGEAPAPEATHPYLDPALHLEMAARYSAQRGAAAAGAAASLAAVGGDLAATADAPVEAEAQWIGEDSKPTTPAETMARLQRRVATEAARDHLGETTALLRAALDRRSGRRRRAALQLAYGEACVRESARLRADGAADEAKCDERTRAEYEAAVPRLTEALEVYESEGWIAPAMRALLLLTRCTRALGKVGGAPRRAAAAISATGRPNLLRARVSPRDSTGSRARAAVPAVVRVPFAKARTPARSACGIRRRYRARDAPAAAPARVRLRRRQLRPRRERGAPRRPARLVLAVIWQPRRRERRRAFARGRTPRARAER